MAENGGAQAGGRKGRRRRRGEKEGEGRRGVGYGCGEGTWASLERMRGCYQGVRGSPPPSPLHWSPTPRKVASFLEKPFKDAVEETRSRPTGRLPHMISVKTPGRLNDCFPNPASTIVLSRDQEL